MVPWPMCVCECVVRVEVWVHGDWEWKIAQDRRTKVEETWDDFYWMPIACHTPDNTLAHSIIWKGESKRERDIPAMHGHTSQMPPRRRVLGKDGARIQELCSGLPHERQGLNYLGHCHCFPEYISRKLEPGVRASTQIQMLSYGIRALKAPITATSNMPQADIFQHLPHIHESGFCFVF